MPVPITATDNRSMAEAFFGSAAAEATNAGPANAAVAVRIESSRN
jgi:hypothetical protein